MIIVMVVIVFLGILAGGFAYSMKVETQLARNANSETDLEWLGRSGIELARYVLSQQMQLTPYDSLNQKWAGGPGNSNDILAAISLDNVQLGPGTVTVKILDMDRKLNINLASPDILQRALTLMNVNASDFSLLTDAIQDWIDPDEQPKLSGAETDYYLSLDTPYYAKNGPLDDISELLMIRGITPEIYWGAAGPHHDPKAVQSATPAVWSPSQVSSYTGGFVDLFCVLSGGQININTASADVLQLLPGIDENMAREVVRGRSGPDGSDGTEDDTPFMNPNELGRAQGMPPQFVQQMARFCGVRSIAFEVQVEAQIGSVKRRYTGVVRRNNQRDLPLLYLYWE